MMGTEQSLTFILIDIQFTGIRKAHANPSMKIKRYMVLQILIEIHDLGNQ